MVKSAKTWNHTRDPLSKGPHPESGEMEAVRLLLVSSYPGIRISTAENQGKPQLHEQHLLSNSPLRTRSLACPFDFKLFPAKAWDNFDQLFDCKTALQFV